MLGVTINAFAVFLAATIGIFFKKYIPERYLNATMLIISLYTVVIGIQGAIISKEPIQVILALIIGAVIGEILDIDGNINKFADFIKEKLKGSNPNFSQGFVTATIVVCTGSLAIIGPLNAALQGDMTILYIKSILDFVICLVFASTYGAGVFLSGIVLFLYQSLFFILAGQLQPVLTPEVINEVSATGSVLVLALGLDLLEIKKFKVANYIPAIFMPMIFYGIKMLFNL